jgi:hypothetical protein
MGVCSDSALDRGSTFVLPRVRGARLAARRARRGRGRTRLHSRPRAHTYARCMPYAPMLRTILLAACLLAAGTGGVGYALAEAIATRAESADGALRSRTSEAHARPSEVMMVQAISVEQTLTQVDVMSASESAPLAAATPTVEPEAAPSSQSELASLSRQFAEMQAHIRRLEARISTDAGARIESESVAASALGEQQPAVDANAHVEPPAAAANALAAAIDTVYTSRIESATTSIVTSQTTLLLTETTLPVELLVEAVADAIEEAPLSGRISNAGFRLTADERAALHRRRSDAVTNGIASSVSEGAAFQRLLKWATNGREALVSVGSGAADCSVSANEDGVIDPCRGVFAREDIMRGEIVLTIPRSRILDMNVVWASEWTMLRGAFAPDNEQMWIAVFILYDYMRPAAFRDGKILDYGPESVWKAYYDTLPMDFTSWPLSFDTSPNSREDIYTWLAGSPTLNVLRDTIRAWQVEYAGLCEAMVTKGFAKLFTQAQWIWARAVVLTRAFGVRNRRMALTPEAAEFSTAMVPLADMLDHAYDADTTWGWSEDGTQFIMSATRDIQAGHVISTTYGYDAYARQSSME